MRRQNNEILPAANFKVQETWSRLGNEVALLEARGHGLEAREAHVFRSLRSLEVKSLNEQEMTSGFDIFRGVKKMFADKIADAVGLQPGFLRDVVTNFVAGLGVSDLKAFVSAGACKPLVTKLAAAVQAAIADKILAALGLEPGNFFAVAIVEALKSGFVQEGPFVKMVSDTVCKIKLSELLPGGGGLKSLFGGAKKQVDGAAAAAAGAAPNAETPTAT